MGIITFKDASRKLDSMLLYTKSNDTYSLRGTSSNPFGSDMFPDTGVLIDDAIVFGGNRYWGKFRKITLDLATPINATSIIGVWEYAVGGAYSKPNWKLLNNVSDNTNHLQNIGVNTVTFDIPDDWDNYHNPSNTGTYYRWFIRFRITSISGLTEGGSLSSVDGSSYIENFKINVSNFSSSIPAIFEDIYIADKNGVTTMVDRVGVTSIDTSSITNKETLRPSDYITLGGARNDLWVTISNLTGITSLTIRLYGTDVSNTIQTEDIIISGNGKFYLKKYFKTLTNTQIINITGVGSFDYVAEYGQWGVVSKKDNQFSFRTMLFIKGNSYIKSQQEVIQFEHNYFLQGEYNTPYLLGEVYSGNKVYNGSTFIFIGSNCNYPNTICGENSKIYNSQFRFIILDKSIGFNGYWGGGIGSRKNQIVYDVYIEGFRNLSFNEVSNTVIGVKSYKSQIETPGAIIKDCVLYGSEFSFRPNRNNKGTYVHSCDISKSTRAPINPWDVGSVDEWVMDFVDCEWGTFVDIDKIKWYVNNLTYTNMKIYETSSVLLKVIDENNNPIQNAIFKLYDKDNLEIYNLTTNFDGYVNIEEGTATATSINTLSDNTKSWASNEWWYKEIVVTSGNAVGERRILAKGNTSTQITMGWDFQTSPNIGDRFVIIPYIRYKAFVPDLTVGNYRPSIVTNSNPFILSIEKEGYETYESKINIEYKIDWTITLKTSKKRLIDTNGDVYLNLNKENVSNKKVVITPL